MKNLTDRKSIEKMLKQVIEKDRGVLTNRIEEVMETELKHIHQQNQSVPPCSPTNPGTQLRNMVMNVMAEMEKKHQDKEQRCDIWNGGAKHNPQR